MFLLLYLKNLIAWILRKIFGAEAKVDNSAHILALLFIAGLFMLAGMFMYAKCTHVPDKPDDAPLQRSVEHIERADELDHESRITKELANSAKKEVEALQSARTKAHTDASRAVERAKTVANSNNANNVTGAELDKKASNY